jgi:hypothetical protein
MGGHGCSVRDGRESTLGNIEKEGYKYLIKLIGVDITTNEPRQGGYQVFKELDEKEMIKYANDIAKEQNFKFSKIEVLSIKLEPVKEIKL